MTRSDEFARQQTTVSGNIKIGIDSPNMASLQMDFAVISQVPQVESAFHFKSFFFIFILLRRLALQPQEVQAVR